MRLTDYARAQGRGVATRLMRRTGLAYSTVVLALNGTAVRYDTARKLSLATNGEVSIEEIDLLGADTVLTDDSEDPVLVDDSEDTARDSHAPEAA